MKKEVNRWFRDGGDNKFRFNYPLDENSLILDCGGYKGEWSEKIFSMYQCNIMIFEPVKKFYDIIKNKFIGNEKIKVFNYGLSDEEKNVDINLLDDGSSVFVDGTNKENIKLRSIYNFINDNKINKIDLLKLNVEGEEYNILDNIIDNNLTHIINSYQIQFHEVIDNYEERRKKIIKNLNNTHKQTYCYLYVWENWEKVN